jgi:hypothetical protein
MATGRMSRALRAATFAAVCVLTTAVGHAWMSGDSVPSPFLAAAFLGTASLAWWLTGRERGGRTVTGSTVVAQLGLHLLFGVGQHTSASAATSAQGHAHHMAHTGSMQEAPSMGTADMASAGHGTTAMFLAHTLAAVVCGLWLWRGEAAAFRLGRTLAASVFVPLRLALRILVGEPQEPRPVAPLVTSPARRLRGVLLQYVVSRRGPPSRLAC